jgi:hypothetical protein
VAPNRGDERGHRRGHQHGNLCVRRQPLQIVMDALRAPPGSTRRGRGFPISAIIQAALSPWRYPERGITCISPLRYPHWITDGRLPLAFASWAADPMRTRRAAATRAAPATPRTAATIVRRSRRHRSVGTNRRRPPVLTRPRHPKPLSLPFGRPKLLSEVSTLGTKPVPVSLTRA